MAQRYDIWIYYDTMETDKDDNGDWVRHEDHAAELATLRAENERLREALRDVMIQDEYTCIRGGVVVKDLGCCGCIAMEALK